MSLRLPRLMGSSQQSYLILSDVSGAAARQRSWAAPMEIDGPQGWLRWSHHRTVKCVSNRCRARQRNYGCVIFGAA
jgi:hypothetical protein